MSNGSWQQDPYGRHQLRWWDGAQWTQMVSDNGVTHDEAAMAASAPLPPPHPMMPAPPVEADRVPAPTPVVEGPPTPNRTRLFAAVGAAVVILAAVVVVIATRGSDNSTKDSQTVKGKQYVAAIMASADTQTFKAGETKCIAEGAVDVIGVETFQKAGVTPESMTNSSESKLLSGFKPTEAQANALVDMMFKCVDFGTMFADAMGATAVSIPADKLRCVGDQLEVNKAFRASLISSMLDAQTTSTDPAAGGDLESAMLEILTKCAVNLANLGS
jgi:hypothetical protein